MWEKSRSSSVTRAVWSRSASSSRRVWGPQYEKETNYLRVYLAQIRRKLEPDPSRPRYFLTEPRMGVPLSERQQRVVL